MVFQGKPLAECQAAFVGSAEQLEDPVMCILLYCVYSVVVCLIISPAMNVVTYLHVVVTATASL